jgi:hypothetical protein
MTTGTGGRPYDTAALPPELFQHWLHSREEDRDGVEVYRPEDFPFPPSFGRDGFEIHPDGRFVQDEIGPADGTVQVEGRWEPVGDGRIEVSFDDRPGYSFDIVELDRSALRIRRVEEPLPPEGRCGNWTAWVDRQPPGPATLYVTGECLFRTGGFTVTLRRRAPQGINPRDLLLDRIVEPPTGPATTALTRVEVRYSEETSAGFDTVTILPDGVTVPVGETR